MASKYPVISNNPRIQRDYVEMRKQGSSHRLAEMLACQQGPSLNTDTRFMSGHVNHNQFEGQLAQGQHYLQEARRAGVNVEGAVYKHQLARYPGDPQAWVRSRGDIKRICEERNMHCEGSVTHKPVEYDIPEQPEGPYQVAEDIVDEAYQGIAEETPERIKDEPDLKDKLRKTFSGGE